jgi:GNAT superfamily N-acetyltransferase
MTDYNAAFDSVFGAQDAPAAATPAAPAKTPPGARRYEQAFDEAFGSKPAPVERPLPVRAVLNAVSTQDPQKAARASDLAKQFGASPDHVAEYLQDYELQAEVMRRDATLKTDPTLMKQFQDSPHMAAKAQRDIDALVKLHGELKGWKVEPTLPNIVSGLISSFPQGFDTARASMTLQMGDTLEALGFVERDDTTRANQLRQAEQAAGRRQFTTPDFETSTARGVYGGLDSLVRLAPGMALSIVARNPAPVLGVAGAQTQTDSYVKYRARGATPLEAQLGANLEAGIEVVTELPAMKFLTDALGKKGASEFVAGLLARDVPLEQIATFGQDAVDTLIANPNKTWGEFLAERPQAAYETLISTFTQAGVMAGVNNVMARLGGRAGEIEEATTTAERVRSALAAAGTVQMREFANGDFEQMMRRVAAEDPDSAGSVFMDAQTLLQAVPRAAELFPSVAATLQDAAATNASVEIPISEVLAAVPGTGLEQAFVENVKGRADSMSLAEARVAASKATEWFEADAQRIMAEAQDSAAQQTVYDMVKGEVAEQLNAAKYASPDVNERFATLISAMVTSMSARLGMDPGQFWQENRLNIIGARAERTPQQMLRQATPQAQAVLNGEQRVSQYSTRDGLPLQLVVRSETLGKGADRQVAVFVDALDPATGERRAAIDFAYDDGTLYAENTRVALQFRRQGIARAMYQAARDAGFDIAPGREQTEMGDAMVRSLMDAGVINAPRRATIEGGNVLNQRAAGDTRYQTRARELAEQVKAPKRSSVGIFTGAEKAPVLATNFDIARFFTRKNRKGMESWPSAAAQKAMVDALYAEAVQALTDDGSAVGWYDRKVKAALDSVAQLHPEIATDEQSKFGFITMLAITSNSTAVNENFEKAEALYRQWKETGAWPTEVPDAKSAAAMRKGMETMQRLVAQHGWEKVRDFMVGDQSIADIEAFAGEPIGGELASSRIYGAVFLGSKIGAFFNNLYGNFTPVTMDRWFMRTINRLRGQMLALPGSFADNTALLREQLANPELDTFGQNREAMLAEIDAFDALSAQDKADVLVVLKVLPKVTAYTKARLAAYQKTGFKARTRENALAKNLNEALTLDQQTPAGGGDRAVLRGVMKKLQDRLRADGIPIEMADLQAVLWYYEKDLFDLLKGKTRQASLINQEGTRDAEDYETAAARLVRLVRGEGAGRAGPGGPEGGAATVRSESAVGRRADGRIDTTGDLFGGLNDQTGTAGQQADAGQVPDGRGVRGRARGVGDARGPDSAANQPLVGLPATVTVDGRSVTFGPFLPAIEAAQRYAEQAGIPYERPTTYARVDQERARRIAQAFEEMEHAPGDPEVAAAYDALINETLAQWQAIKETGLVVEFIDGPDPYGNPRNAILDVVSNNHLWVYPTDAGFGGSESAAIDISGNPLLRVVEGETISGRQVRANDIFRIVHDYFGHIKEGVGFRAEGEENAWRAHWAMFTPLARRALTTETRGQNSWVNFGPFAEFNKTANGAETQYAPQKIGLLPDWAVNEGATDAGSEQSVQRRMRQEMDLAVLQWDTLLKQQAGGPYEGKPGEVAVTGVHFSKGARTTLQGAYYGTGLRGAERDRVFNGADARLRSRVYFYVDEGKGVRPEAGVGGTAHSAELSNLYDINVDPLKLIVGGDINATETNILNAGFDGYYRRDAFNQQGAAVVIGPAAQAIPATPIPNPTTAAPPVQTSDPVYTYGLLSREANLLDIEAIRAAAPSAQLRGGNFRVNQAEFEAARRVAAQQGVELPVAELAQGTNETIRGGYDVNRMTVVLTEHADLSTFIHEAGHYFLETLMKYGVRADASESVRSDVERVLKWFGVESPQAWLDMTPAQRTPYHERWAESFEQYKLEGKAPTKELQPIFRKFSAYLKDIYKSVKGLLSVSARRGSDMTLQLNDEIRGVFDRLLAADVAVQQAEERIGGPVTQEATDAALEQLEARSLRDAKWAANARSRHLKKLQAEARDTRKRVREEVAADVEMMPEVQARKAIDALRVVPEHQVALDQHKVARKAALETAERDAKAQAIAEEEARTGEKLEGLVLGRFVSRMRREIDNTVDRMMITWDRANPRPLRPVNETDQDMATIADSFGFPDVATMMQAINDFGRKDDVIEAMVDQRMLEEYGDLVDQRAMEEAATEAVHNEARARALATQLAAEDAATNPRADTGEQTASGARVTVNALLEAAKQFAKQVTGRTLVNDLRQRRQAYLASEKRAAQASRDGAATGDARAGLQARQDQLLNNAVARSMTDAIAQSQKMLEFLRKVTEGNSERLVEKGRDPDVVNAMRAVLAEFGIGTRTTRTAAQYLDAVKTNDAETAQVLAEMVEPLREFAQPISALTFDQLTDLHDAMQAMWFLSRQMRQMEVAGEKVDIADAAEELTTRLETLGVVPLQGPGANGSMTPREELVSNLRFVRAALTRVEQWADSFGPQFTRYIFRPIKEAADRYRTDRVSYRKRYLALLKNIAPALRDGPITAPELGGFTFGRGKVSGHTEVLHAILHTGNESNKRKLLLGRGWATEREDGTLDTSRWDTFVARMQNSGYLQKEHYDFAQAVWDLLEEIKPLAQKAHREVYGRYFEEVTANAFETPFGSYRGGYVPAQADVSSAIDRDKAALNEQNEALVNAFPSAARGFTKSRVNYNTALTLDLASLGRHIDQVLRFAHMQPAVRGVTRLLKNKGFAQSLSKVDNAAITGLLLPFLNRAARQSAETPVLADGATMRLASVVRARAGMALMMGNVINAVQQLTGFVNAAVKVRPGLLVQSAAQFAANPAKFNNAVREASPFMRDRMANEIGAINEAMDDILLSPTLLKNAQAWTMRHAYFLQAAVDNTMSPIVWTGAYNQALATGASHADAVAEADSAVRTTQTSTLPEDISRAESGSAILRLFTQFANYFNMLANTSIGEMAKLSRDGGLAEHKARALYVVFAGVLLPIWLAEGVALALRGGPEDEDDDGLYWDDWISDVMGFGTVKSLAAAVPGLGPIVTAGINRFNDNPMDDRASLSPVVSLLETTAGLPYRGWRILTGEEVKARTAVNDAATAVTVITGLPVRPAARPVGYLAGVAQGEIDPTSMGDFIRGLITGAPSEESKQ